MRALTYQAVTKVSVEEVPDPTIIEPTDAVIRVTSAAICGSDLHLYDVFGPYLDKGDVLGHETMGVVTAVGTEVSRIKVGDRVVVPFVIACGHCFMCDRGLFSQCETTQVTEYDSGATLYGYTKLYGQIPGGQAEQLRIQRADFNLINVGDDLPDERYLFLSDILPTAWQGVEYAEVPDGGTLVVLGLGPVGQFASRIGVHKGYRVIAVDPVPERRAMAERHGVETLDLTNDVVGDHQEDDRRPRPRLRPRRRRHGGPRARCGGAVPEDRRRSSRRGRPGRHAEGGHRQPRRHAPRVRRRPPRWHGVAQRCLRRHRRPDAVPEPVRQADLASAWGSATFRSGPTPCMPLVEDPADPLGTEDLVTHPVPLEQAAEMYDLFKTKERRLHQGRPQALTWSPDR